MLKTPRELLHELGEAVRARRIAQGWSQGEAASRAGVGVRTWRRLEIDGQATIETLVNAAIALRCEEGLSQLFPAPAANSLDELLRRQEAAARPKPPSAGAAAGSAPVRLAPGTPLGVALAMGPAQARLPVGRLAMDAGLMQLEWSREVITRKLALGGLLYPPEAGLQGARGRAFDGLHGFLADSLPEGWGYLLMRKRLARLGVDIASLTPLERLALVGEHGRGALVFEPSTAPPEDVASLDLDLLAAEATALLTGREAKLADTLAGLAGGSGGARPKVHVGFDGHGGISIGEGEIAPGHAAWIVKFHSPEDPIDIGPIEQAYALMAQASGLTLSEHRLIEARRGAGYFATRRFDRPDGGGRLHMISLAGAIEAPSNIPSTSYDMFMRATRSITRRADDVAAVFRRMVFNVLACNRDDHTRQHAYLMDTNGDWRLAPAYDLTYSPGPGGEHYMDIAGEGRRPTRAHVAELGQQHGYNARQVATVIETVRLAVADWPSIARGSGVSAASTKAIGDAHARVWADFEPK